MPDWMFTTTVLAQEPQGQPPEQKGQQTSSPWTMFVPLVVIMAVFYFIFIRPQKREQAKRDVMLRELKKDDRVVTIGGIIGTIANVTNDGKEVTLKVDDNTRLKMLRSSIQTVLSDKSEPSAS